MATLSTKAQLKSLGTKINELLPSEVGAFLFVEYSDSMPLTQLWRNDQKQFSISGDSKRLLGVCSKRQRSVLIHDSEKDILLKGIKVRTFASALCVPVLDEDKIFLGTLLVVSEKSSAFAKEDKFALERLTRELAPVLKSSRKLPGEAKEEASSRLSFLFSKSALAVMGVLLAFFGLWLSAPTPVSKEVAPVTPVEVKEDAVVEKCEQFLQSLRDGRYEQAWQNLSPELKREWSSAEFERDMRDWAETGDFGEVLNKRKISKVQRHLTEARVTLLESALRGDRGPWDWNLQQIDGEWVIVTMKGPINSPTSSNKS